MASKAVEVAHISVRVSPDTKEFRRKLKTELDEIERVVKGNVQVEAHLNSGQAKADFQRMLGIMKIEGAKGVKVTAHVDVDKNEIASAGRAVNRAMKSSSGFSKWIPSFGSGINPGGYVAILGAVVALAAPLIGLLSTTLLAIPGLISLIATPILAIGLGLDGIKKAATDSGLLTFDKKGKPSLGAALDGVQGEVSKAFEEGLKPVFASIKTALPDLLASLPAVATGLSNLFKGFTDALTSKEGIGFFNETIANIGAAMTAAAPGIQAFSGGLLNLTTAFTRELPGLVEWFNKTGTDFQGWVTKMTTIDPATGDSPMGESFKALGNTLKTVGDWLVDLAKAGLDFVKDPAKMDGFIETLKNIGDAITALVELGNKLGPVWRFLSQGKFSNLGGDGGNGAKGGGASVPATDGGVGGDAAGIKSAIETQTQKQELADEGAKSTWTKIKDTFLDWKLKFSPQTRVGSEIVSKDISGEELKKTIDSQLAVLRGELDTFNKAVESRTNSSVKTQFNDQLDGYKKKVEDIKAQIAELNQVAADANIQPDVALKAASEAIKPEDIVPTKIPPVDTSEALNSLGAIKLAVEQAGVDGGAAATKIPGQIEAGVGDMTAIGNGLGNNFGIGFAGGIDESTLAVTTKATAMGNAAVDAAKKALDQHSPSERMRQVGLMTGKGMEIGMEQGFGPVLDQATDLANKISAAFASGNIDPTGALAGYSKADVNRVEKVLKLEIKRLEIQAKALDAQAKLTGNSALKAQAKAIRDRKEELSLQKDMVDLAGDYNDETGKGGAGGDPLVKAASGLMKSPVDFAKATGQQFLSDIGIGGNGAISKGLTEGIKYVFNVANMDDALSAQGRQQSTDALSIVGR